MTIRDDAGLSSLWEIVPRGSFAAIFRLPLSLFRCRKHPHSVTAAAATAYRVSDQG